MNRILWTALVTPLNTDDTVDFESLKKLCLEQEENNIGILILGSTGEALNLSLSEKKEIIKFVTNLNLKTPIMAGVGGHGLSETLEWLKFLETQNIGTYLMVTPLYAKPGVQGQTEWFKTLMDHSTRPCMLYNVPSRTGVQLPPEVIGNLKNHKNLWALKEASGDPSRTMQYLAEKNNLEIYCGDDGLMSEYASFGARGLVSVASNVWPAETYQYVEKCLDSTIKDLEIYKKCFDALFVVSNPVPAKFLLAHQKRISAFKMRCPLSHKDMNDESLVLEADLQIKKLGE